MRCMLFAVATLLAAAGSAFGEDVDPWSSQRAEVQKLYDADKDAEAIAPAEQLIEAQARALGHDHFDLVPDLFDLGKALERLDRDDEAERIFRRVLSIEERERGPSHAQVDDTLYEIVELRLKHKQYSQAEELVRNILSRAESATPPRRLGAATAWYNLASMARRRGDRKAAEDLMLIAIHRLNREDPIEAAYAAQLISELSGWFNRQARCKDAGDLHRSLGFYGYPPLVEDQKAVKDLDAAIKLAKSQVAQEQPKIALETAAAAVAQAARIYGPCGTDDDSLGARRALIQAHNQLKDFQSAHREYLKMRDLVEYSYGARSMTMSRLLREMGEFYREWNHQDAYNLIDAARRLETEFSKKDTGEDQQRARELAEERNLRRAMSVEQLEEDARKILGGSITTYRLSQYAEEREEDGDLAVAEKLHRRALELALASESEAKAGLYMSRLASHLKKTGRQAEALALTIRSIDIERADHGFRDNYFSLGLSNAAFDAFQLGELQTAYKLAREAVDIEVWNTKTRFAGDALHLDRAVTPFETRYGLLHLLASIGWRIAENDPQRRKAIATELFELAQWANHAQSSRALARMSARSAASDPETSALIRRRQDRGDAWAKIDRQLLQAKTKPDGVRETIADLERQWNDVDAEVSRIDRSLAMLPQVGQMSNAWPLVLADARTLLKDDEAIVLTLDRPDNFHMPEATFVWVVTKEDILWSRADISTAGLKREVAALRCGLDATSWDHPEDFAQDTPERRAAKNAQRAKADACLSASKVRPPDIDSLPFDAARAHALYTALFGEVGQALSGKQLLVVPSGALTQLPFQVLVTAPPPPAPNIFAADYRQVAWLARSHAITVLPSVSALTALRRNAKPSKAQRTMIGFGNPLLDGTPNRDEQIAKDARDRQDCRQVTPERVAALVGWRGGGATVGFRGGRADVGDIKRQTPLPETADELCAVAGDLKADAKELRLGARATESELKRLSEAKGEERLSNYGILHFATHATLAGQISDTTEPGLILTPPAASSGEDDGFLSASEVAALKLDANWVILSACNTAGSSGGEGAEAMSGLARAFFYAQARALLVSHWEVDSISTVALVTSAMRQMTQHVGRAEALRRAMLALIDKGQRYQAHPSNWAPFVVVGEGGASLR